MRTVILCLLLLLTASLALAGDSPSPLHLHARDIVGLVSFGALGGMLFWHLRK